MSNKTKESIIERYNKLQPDGGSRFTPRLGTYLIQEVFEDSKYLTIYKAKALWKEDGSEDFIDGAEVIIQLTSFKETAQNPECFDPEALTNKVVVVEETFWSETIYKSKTYPIVKCTWKLDSTPPVIRFDKPKVITLIPSFLDLGGSLNDSLQLFEQSLTKATLMAMELDENKQIEEAYFVEEHCDQYLEHPGSEEGDDENADNPFR